jgi:hypothetical protein
MMSKWEIKKSAAKQFAAANGWRLGRYFDRWTFAGIKAQGTCYTSLGDHADYFWKDRKPVAIAAHNYPGPEEGTEFLGRTLTGSELELDPMFYEGGGNHYGVADIAREAGALGLVTHVAPTGAAASWYYPHHSVLIVVTRPGIEIVWPTPEQTDSTARDWTASDEAMRRPI